MPKLSYVILVLLSPILMGAAYTVGPSGKDYTAIQSCLNAATTAGDSCTVYAGDYTAEGRLISKANGSEGSLITLQANGTDLVQVATITVSHNYNKVNGINIHAPSGWSNEGMILSGSNCQITNNLFDSGFMGNPGSYAINNTGSSNTISGNTIQGSTLSTGGTHTGSNAAATLTDSTKSWATNALAGLRLFNQTNQKFCTVTSNTSNTATCTLSDGESWDTGDYYTVGPTFFIVFYNNGNSNTYSGNTIKNVVDVERIWDLYGDDNIIDGNEAYNLIWSGYSGIHPDIFQVVDSAVITSKRQIIQNNYFHDLDAQIGINEMRAANTGGWVVRNNVFANVTQRFMLVGNGSVYNNTFYNQGDASGIIGFNNDVGQTANYKNNIFIGSATGDTEGLMYGTWSGTVNLGNNYYSKPDYSARSAAAINALGDTNYVNGGDPKFIAPYTNCITNTCNFNIASDSPLKDVGADLSGVWASALDKDGVSRPQGVGWSIGAYEYAEQTGNISGAVLSGAVVK